MSDRPVCRYWYRPSPNGHFYLFPTRIVNGNEFHIQRVTQVSGTGPRNGFQALSNSEFRKECGWTSTAGCIAI